MIFRPQLARLIVAGRKTQTRRRRHDQTCRYAPGRTYAVQRGRGAPAIARIEIVSIEPQTLGEITFAEARREGFRTRNEFFEYWRRLYSHRADCWECDASELAAADLDAPVWVITFALAEPIRIPALDSTHGYVNNRHQAMVDEPEAPDKATTDAFAKAALQRDQALREERRRALPRRYGTAKARARSAGVDVSRQESTIERAVLDIERKTGKAA